MARPHYETSADMQNEEGVRVFLESVSKDGCSVLKVNPAMYPFDFAVVAPDSKIKCFVEVKCINYEYGSYPMHRISAGKMASCVDVAEKVGVPFYLVVRWLDRIGLFEMSSDILSGLGAEWFGRRESRDAYDSEPCFSIPIDRFTTVASGEKMKAAFIASPNMHRRDP